MYRIAMKVQPSDSQATALQQLLSAPRLAPFHHAAKEDRADTMRLYFWNVELAGAFHEMVAVLEVCMRNAMNRELCVTFGEYWYAVDGLFDERTINAIARAWAQADGKQGAKLESVLPGKLIGAMSFGAWCQLLDAGGHTGRDPQRHRRDYDKLLWRTALHRAFPNSDGRRHSVHSIAVQVHAVRNRIAHHEPLISGIPLRGQSGRLSSSAAHDAMLTLAGYIDADLQDWLADWSRVPQLLDARPA